MRHLTKFSDLDRERVELIIQRAFEYKKASDNGLRFDNQLNGKVVGLVFEKPSLRTKVAFEVAALYLGGAAVFLTSEQILASGQNQRGRESIPDIARNLERFVDMVVARVYSHTVINEMSSILSKPLINALCDQHHPTQILADLMAIRWHKGESKVKVAYIGDANNVATSLLEMCSIVGYDFSIASPLNYEMQNDKKEFALQIGKKTGSKLSFLVEPMEAVSGADVVYSDTFVSMGYESEKTMRINVFAKYQVNKELFNNAKSDAVFMHCLPAHRGEEVTDEVMDGERSIVFDQAECRLHIAKSLIYTMLCEKG